MPARLLPGGTEPEPRRDELAGRGRVPGREQLSGREAGLRLASTRSSAMQKRTCSPGSNQISLFKAPA